MFSTCDSPYYYISHLCILFYYISQGITKLFFTPLKGTTIHISLFVSMNDAWYQSVLYTVANYNGMETRIKCSLSCVCQCACDNENTMVPNTQWKCYIARNLGGLE